MSDTENYTHDENSYIEARVKLLAIEEVTGEVLELLSKITLERKIDLDDAAWHRYRNAVITHAVPA